MLQYLYVLLVARGPKLKTVLEVQPHQCPVQGHDHLPTPADHTVPDTSQDAVGLPGHLVTLLAHLQLAVNQHPKVLFCWADFQPLFSKPVALHGVVVTELKDLAFGLVEPHTIGFGPSIQPVQIPLQSLPTLKQIDTPNQLGVICKLTEGGLNPLIQIIDKVLLNKTDLETEPWGTQLMSSRQQNLSAFMATHCSRPFIQFFIQKRVHPSKPWVASFSRRMQWEQCQRPY